MWFFFFFFSMFYELYYSYNLFHPNPAGDIKHKTNNNLSWRMVLYYFYFFLFHFIIGKTKEKQKKDIYLFCAECIRVFKCWCCLRSWLKKTKQKTNEYTEEKRYLMVLYQNVNMFIVSVIWVNLQHTIPWSTKKRKILGGLCFNQSKLLIARKFTLASGLLDRLIFFQPIRSRESHNIGIYLGVYLNEVLAIISYRIYFWEMRACLCEEREK